jgi:hypothetical protein
MTLPVYIGYDDREKIAYDVCKYSLARTCTIPISIFPLVQAELRAKGIYRRQFWLDGGVKIDSVDGRPFSTEFTFTRFLVPHLRKYSGWALFCDCDFLFRADISELLPYTETDKAVYVVHHNHVPKETEKMDGQNQAPYPRKNWSSFILWNCAHPANKELTPHVVNTQTGRWLHAFSWLKDEEIGELPLEWNWLAKINDSAIIPKAVHFTLGIPEMAGYENSPYSDEWCKAAKEIGDA